MKKIFLKISICCAVLSLSACLSEGPTPTVYYKGTQPNSLYSRPPVASSAANQAPAAPVYYGQPYQNQQQYQQPYQQAPQPYGYPAASRSYSNPYAFQPQAQYPYYDSDHYYVPPTYYGSGAPDAGTAPPPNR